MFIAVASLTLMGIALGGLLGLAARYLAVEENPLEAELQALSKSLRPAEEEVGSVSNVWIFSIQEASFLNNLAMKAAAEKWSDAQLEKYGLEWIK